MVERMAKIRGNHVGDTRPSGDWSTALGISLTCPVFCEMSCQFCTRLHPVPPVFECTSVAGQVRMYRYMALVWSAGEQGGMDPRWWFLAGRMQPCRPFIPCRANSTVVNQ